MSGKRYPEECKIEVLRLLNKGVSPSQLAEVKRSPLGKTLGRERMFFNLESAVEAHLSEKGEPQANDNSHEETDS